MTGKNDQKLEIEISSDGGRVSFNGDGASRLTNAIADFLSPLSHGFGLLGDQLENYRIHRKISATAALERAKEIIAERGKFPIPISPKILAPWLEAASLEDLDQSNLIEIWARILASSANGFDSTIAAFIDICRRIGPDEASIFPYLIRGDEYLSEDFSEEIDARVLDHVIHTSMQANLIGHLEGSGETEHFNFERFQKNQEEWPLKIDGIIPAQVFARSGGFGAYLDVVDRKKAISLQILVREGLAEFSERTFSQGHHSVGIRYARGTKLAYEFVRRIYPEGLPEKDE